MTTAAVDREHALVDRAGRGDLEALDAIVERHAARLYRLAHGITRSAHDAEAVVREVLAAVLAQREGLDPAVPFGTWLARTVTRAALARGGRGPVDDATLDPWLPTFLPDGHRDGDRAFVTADWSRLPDGQLIRRGALGVVHDALDALSAVDRAILLLSDLEGAAAEDVGAAVGAHPAVVRVRLHHLRMILRERLARALGPPPALP